MNKIVRILAPFIAVLSASCGGGSDVDDSQILFTDILCEQGVQGLGKGISLRDSRNSIINYESDFTALWDELGGAEEGMPTIDFSNGTVVVVYTGSRGTNNEWLQVSSITKSSSGGTSVYYNSYSASFENCGGSAVVSHPICIVQADAQFDTAKFDFETLNSCEADLR